MSVTVCKEIKNDEHMMRDVYGQTLAELAKNDRNVLAMDADLMSAMGTKAFEKQFPEQTVNCGIQEADLMGVAAGLSAVGKIPFAHTFGCFASRRAYDQIYMSGAYAKLNVKVIGSDPGVTAALNGGTHMPFEDMGTMASIPEMQVIEPTDNAVLRSVMPQMAKHYGMQYMRLVRKDVKKVYEEGSTFTIGKAVQLRDGKDVAIIACGYCVAEAMAAADTLAAAGINARVIDMFTIKPLDEEAVLAAAADCGAIVTAENHNVTNGLGSLVANCLAKNRPTPVEMIGVQDLFGQVGPVDFLADHYKLTAPYIVEAAKKVIARKG